MREQLKKSDFYYDLPQELIAQVPLQDRSGSRLLMLHKESGRTEHHIFREIAEYLRPGDCLVLNNTKVIPARLLGVKEDTGAAVEVLLLKHREDDVWETLVRPGRKLRPGAKVSFGDGSLRAEVLDIAQEGSRLVRFTYDGIFEEALDRLGEMPLPPYIKQKLEDGTRYQTVYAKYDGSAAAPTAGLHFTEALLEQIAQKGVELVYVTLHVGLGTFRPVKTENILDHHMRRKRRSGSTGRKREAAVLSVWELRAAAPWRARRTKTAGSRRAAAIRISLSIRGIDLRPRTA